MLRIGIDLGTNTTIIYVQGKGIVLKEPSVVAIDTRHNKVVAVGREAKEMIGRTPSTITAERPIRDGVIANYEATEAMLKYFINRARRVSFLGRFLKPDVAICIPAVYTSLEEQAIKEAAYACGARRVELIEEPMAAAIGAGLPVNQAKGYMVVDIGGGTTDIAVISLGSIIVRESIRVAGDKMDQAILKYIRRHFNLHIGEQTAERIKIYIGSAYRLDEELTISVKGRDVVTGMPRNIEISSEIIRDALREPVSEIVEAVKRVLERTPPELAADIIDTGITLTGGGALLKGLDKLLAEVTGINVHVPPDPIDCVGKGTGKFIESYK